MTLVMAGLAKSSLAGSSTQALWAHMSCLLWKVCLALQGALGIWWRSHGPRGPALTTTFVFQRYKCTPLIQNNALGRLLGSVEGWLVSTSQAYSPSSRILASTCVMSAG